MSKAAQAYMAHVLACLEKVNPKKEPSSLDTVWKGLKVYSVGRK